MHSIFAWGAPVYVLERSQFVARPPDETFAFFQDPLNLPRITPAWLDFRILNMEPARIEQGTRIEYSLRWFGVKYRWRTLIESWSPGEAFVDRQERGPYILWHHTHTFEAHENGTLMKDRVRYRVPFGPFGSALHALLVRKQLKEIFDYRARMVAEYFTPGTALPGAAVEVDGGGAAGIRTRQPAG